MQGNVLGSRAGRRLIALLAVAVALVTAAAMLVAPAPAVAAEQRDVLEGLPVSFAVSGQPKGDAEFSATLTPKSADAPMPAAGGEVAARKGAGDASFGQIEVTVPGVWEYEVRQTTKLDGSRWTLDPTVYHVEVVAEWHDGKFDAVYKVYSDPSKPGDKKEKVAFTNTYIADGSWQVDPGEKWFENGELKGGDFTFDIFRREGDDWVKVAETTNGAGVEKTADGKKYSVGSWAFEGIALTQPGDYEYKVLERLPEGADASDGFKLDGITYDSSVYYYDVTVEVVGGAYEATSVECRDADGKPVDVVKFSNSKDPEKPNATAGKPLAKTGDASWGLAVFSGILLAAGVGFVVVSLVLRKRNA